MAPLKPNLPQPKLLREMNGRAGTGCPRSCAQPCLHQTLQKAKPNISKSPSRLFAPLPRGLRQKFLFTERGRSNSSRYSVSECLFSVCWYRSAPASAKLPNVLSAITSPGHPKYSFAAPCSVCLSPFATTDASPQILGGNASPWAVRPYQNTEVEMQIQKSLRETSASCTCSPRKASLQTHQCRNHAGHARGHCLNTPKTLGLLVQG